MTPDVLRYYEDKVCFQIENCDDLEESHKIALTGQFLTLCSPEQKANMAKCILWYEGNIPDLDKRQFGIMSTLIHDIRGIVNDEDGFDPRSSSYSKFVVPQIN